MATFTLSSSLLPKPLTPLSHSKPFTPTSSLHIQCCSLPHWNPTLATKSRPSIRVAAVDGDFSARRSSSSGNSNEPRETIMLPGCDYNHWLIVMEFPKDPAPTREQMIDTYLNTLATVLGRVGFYFYFFSFLLLLWYFSCLRVCVCVEKKMHYYESLNFSFLFPGDDTELIYNWVNEKRVFSSYDFECSSMRNLGFFCSPIFLLRKMLLKW